MIEKFPSDDFSPEKWHEFTQISAKFEAAIIEALKAKSENIYKDYSHICHALLRVIAFMTTQNKDEKMDALVMGSLEEYIRELRRRQNDKEGDKEC